MQKLLSDKNTMLCFSPPVMIATFVIELLLAVVLLVRNHKSPFSRAAAFLLILLAIFQVSEYLICAAYTGSIMWARIGMAAITLLPPTGIYLISLITGKFSYLKISFALGISFAIYFLLIPGSLAEPVCGGNYVVLNLSQTLYWVYSAYYAAFLYLGMWKVLQAIKLSKNGVRRKRALQWSIAAYASFILPTAIAYLIYPVTPYAIPSIMCGFALVMALILAFKVVPLYNSLHEDQ